MSKPQVGFDLTKLVEATRVETGPFYGRLKFTDIYRFPVLIKSLPDIEILAKLKNKIQ